MSQGERLIALAAAATLLSVVSLVPLSSRAEEPGRPKAAGYPDVAATKLGALIAKIGHGRAVA
jgi:hypothetical protein